MDCDGSQEIRGVSKHLGSGSGGARRFTRKAECLASSLSGAPLRLPIIGRNLVQLCRIMQDMPASSAEPAQGFPVNLGGEGLQQALPCLQNKGSHESLPSQ
jgi:hypothetical protein